MLVDEEESDDSPWTDEESDLLRLEACRMLDSFGKNEPGRRFGSGKFLRIAAPE